jgi:C_GCAxxG_C_C family probable redox protein
MPTPAGTAVALHSQGFNCAQSVFSVFAAQLGIDNVTALKIASPFGGGMARRGETCGAVSGALLALGLARGASDPSGKDEIYRLSQEFLRLFDQKHGALLCRDLVGFDGSTPEGWQAARQAGKFTTICPLLVRDAVELVQSLLGTT